MFLQEGRRRARPSIKSIVLSVLILTGSIYLAAARFFYSDVYLPLIASLAIALAVFAYRGRILLERMPEPYGKGKISRVDAKTAMRSGILLTVLGGLSVVGLMGSVFILPPELFFTLLFGVIAGLPLSEVFFFGLTTMYERRSGSLIFFVSEEAGSEREPLLLKAVELAKA